MVREPCSASCTLTAIEGDEFPDFLLHGVDREGNRVSSVAKALEAIEN